MKKTKKKNFYTLYKEILNERTNPKTLNKSSLTIKTDGLPEGRTDVKKVNHPENLTSKNPEVRKKLFDMADKGGEPMTKKHPVKGKQ